VNKALSLIGPWTRGSVIEKYCNLAVQSNMKDVAENLALNAFIHVF
jgi:hypothetical protein